MDKDCIFCKILKGEIPSAKVYEDDNVYAFLDIGPVNKGHALVIPKEHHETVMDMPDELLCSLAVAAKKTCSAVMEATSADGVNLQMSNYKAAGQLVPHAHFHVIPRFEGDGFKHWAQGKYEEGEMDQYKEKIAKLFK